MVNQRVMEEAMNDAVFVDMSAIFGMFAICFLVSRNDSIIDFSTSYFIVFDSPMSEAAIVLMTLRN
jgi:hypothetical protein